MQSIPLLITSLSHFEISPLISSARPTSLYRMDWQYLRLHLIRLARLFCILHWIRLVLASPTSLSSYHWGHLSHWLSHHSWITSLVTGYRSRCSWHACDCRLEWGWSRLSTCPSRVYWDQRGCLGWSIKSWSILHGHVDTISRKGTLGHVFSSICSTGLSFLSVTIIFKYVFSFPPVKLAPHHLSRIFAFPQNGINVIAYCQYAHWLVFIYMAWSSWPWVYWSLTNCFLGLLQTHPWSSNLPDG